MKMQNRGGWEVAGVGGGLPCIIGPRDYYQAPTPPGDRWDVFQGRVGCADTKGLFACCPLSLGIASGRGLPASPFPACIPVSPGQL